MAICKTGCTNNTDICDGGALCCIGFAQGCGEGCADLADGESRIEIDNNGDLVVCSNVGGNCTCSVIAGNAPVDICTELATCDIEDLGNVAAGAVAGQGLTFDGTDWIPTTLATGNSDSLVDNGNGVFVHTAVDGSLVPIDICANLAFCDLDDLGDVAAGATAGQVLMFDGANWTPANLSGSDSLVNNADGTFTHTAVDGTIVIIDICANLAFCNIESLANVEAGATDGQVLVYNFAASEWQPETLVTGSDTLVDNGDGSFTHTSVAGAVVTFDVCVALANCQIENVGNVLPGAVNGQVLVFDGTNWVPSNQTANTDTLVDNGDGTYTHTSVAGLPTLIDICGDLIHCNLHQLGDVTGGATAGQVLVYNGANWIPTTPPLNVDSLVDNGNGSFTHTAVDGTAIVVNICTMLGDADCDLETMGNVAAGATNGQILVYNGTDWIPTNQVINTDSLVNNGNGSFTHTAVDGTVTVVNICTMLGDADCDLETMGNVAAGATPGQVLVYNGTDWIPTNTPLDSDSLVNNGDGTYTHTAVDGTIVIIDICAALPNCTIEQVGNVAAGATPGQVLVYNGTDWIPSTIGDSLVDNGDGTYTHTAVDGTIVNIDICAALTVVDSDCIDMTIAPTATGCAISADIIIDPDVCNATECRPTGLYTPSVIFINEVAESNRFVVINPPLGPSLTPDVLPVTLIVNNPSTCCDLDLNVRFQAHNSYVANNPGSPFYYDVNVNASFDQDGGDLLGGFPLNSAHLGRLGTIAGDLESQIGMSTPGGSWVGAITLPAGGATTFDGNTSVDVVTNTGTGIISVIVEQMSISVFGMCIG